MQIRLAGEPVTRFVNEWIVRLEDVTWSCYRVADALNGGLVPDELPDKLEQPYPLSPALQLKPSRTILPP